MKLTTDAEKKKYILRHWKTSNGKKIAKMLKRYWVKEDIVLEARKIFGVK